MFDKMKKLTALFLAAVCLGGCSALPGAKQEEVCVYPFEMVGYVSYYAGGKESYGVITTDRVQTIYVTPTQSVTEILVYQGQEVEKGDVLYRYDTTLSDMELERKDLSIQQMEINLKSAQAELKSLKAMKPMVLPDEPEEEEDEPANKSPSDETLVGKIYNADTAKGTSSRTAFRVWLKSNTQVTEEMIREYLTARDPGMGKEVYVIFGIASKPDSEYTQEYGVRYKLVTYETEADNVAAASEVSAKQEDSYSLTFLTNTIETTETTDPTDGTGESSEPTEESSDPTEESTDPSEESSDPTEESTDPSEESSEPTEESSDPTDESTDPTEESSDPTEESSDPTEESTDPSEETTEPTEESTEPETVTVESISMRFFVPAAVTQEEDSEIIWNSGYTSSELKSMRDAKQKEIDELKIAIKMGKAELNIMEQEADDGEVTAEFDGVVTSVLEPENALALNAPMIKVAGGGGFYAQGSVSELELSTIEVGQKVTVTSWDTYMSYEGTITEIGSYPSEEENYFYNGNTNVSYYPYKVFIDEAADLQEGYYVSLTYQNETAEEGVMYLENAFLLAEDGAHCVYVRNGEGLLEKRYVVTGENDGYMTQILSGLSTTDLIAFPYGKSVKEGTPTVEGTWDDLYGY